MLSDRSRDMRREFHHQTLLQAAIDNLEPPTPPRTSVEILCFPADCFGGRIQAVGDLPCPRAEMVKVPRRPSECLAMPLRMCKVGEVNVLDQLCRAERPVSPILVVSSARQSVLNREVEFLDVHLVVSAHRRFGKRQGSTPLMASERLWACRFHFHTPRWPLKPPESQTMLPRFGSSARRSPSVFDLVQVNTTYARVPTSVEIQK